MKPSLVDGSMKGLKMENYEEERNGHKKLVVPLIVLMLCAVACVGVGYAYSSSMNGHGSADVEYFEISLDTEKNVTEATFADKLVFDTTVTSEGTTYTLSEGASVSFKVYVVDYAKMSGTPVLAVSDCAATLAGFTFTVTPVVGDYDAANHCFNVTLNVTATGSSTTAPADVPFTFSLKATTSSA